MEPSDLRVKRSRKNLTDALCTLIRDRPLHKISVRDITEEAMVNRSTFYAHFVDKYDLFSTAIGERMRQDLAREFEDYTTFNPANLRTLIVVGAALIVRISDDCRRTSMAELTPVFMNEMQKSFHEIVSQWISRLEIAVTEAKALSIFATGAVFGAGLLWAQRTDRSQPPDELADQIMPMLLEGIARFTA